MEPVTGMLWGLTTWRDVAISVGLVLAAVVVGIVVHAITYAILGKVAPKARTPWAERAIRYSRKPNRLIFPLLVISIVVPSLQLPPRAVGIIGHLTSLLFIAAIAYLFISLIQVLRDLLLAGHKFDTTDNLAARQAHTQVHVLEKVLYAVVVVATASFMLMTFDGVRQIGVSILASAGIAGIVLGFAAQKTLGTLLAGIQIAITQPIRLDDVVIVEGEWGWIEELTLTYVVVRIWDQRRLVLPITYFIETPFENWTRRSAQILGTVFLYLDYTVPVEAIRQELNRLVDGNDLWDGRVATVQVTDARSDALEVRLLVSASDSGKAWELRCLLREKMIEFVQREYPESLPRVRARLEREEGGGGPAVQMASEGYEA